MYIFIHIYVYIYICCCRFKRKTEAQAIFLNQFTICSWCKWKFVVCMFVYQYTAHLVIEFWSSFTSIMHQYYRPCDCYSAYRRGTVYFKKILARQMCPLPSFACRHGLERRANNNISCGLHIAPILHIGAMLFVLLYPFFQNSAISWPVLTGNGNMIKIRRRVTKKRK